MVKILVKFSGTNIDDAQAKKLFEGKPRLRLRQRSKSSRGLRLMRKNADSTLRTQTSNELSVVSESTNEGTPSSCPLMRKVKKSKSSNSLRCMQPVACPIPRENARDFLDDDNPSSTGTSTTEKRLTLTDGSRIALMRTSSKKAVRRHSDRCGKSEIRTLQDVFDAYDKIMSEFNDNEASSTVGWD